MQSALQKVVVVGGNGFIGSAVCRVALARGFQVTSISSSGKPFTTPKGHLPTWTSKVDWQTGDALHPETYAHHLSGATAVVHTLGTLLDDTSYKAALRAGDTGALVRGLFRLGASNPLDRSASAGGYERLNRDAALACCTAFAQSTPSAELAELGPRAFVYISAEDIFRPLIPAGYIETKREAERGIADLVQERPGFRAVSIRPSLVYHAHLRPFTAPVAALLDLSATVHARVPNALPTPADALRALSRALPTGARTDTHVSTSSLDSIANALVLPPIHVDHVAEACCIAADVHRADVQGVYGVREIRELIGWAMKGQRSTV